MYLSVCVLVKNEAKLLYNCLQSICDYVDEIVVANNESVDETVEVAKQFGASIINVQGAGFDNLRNAYIEVAKGDWILVLDADETFEKRGIEEIRKVIELDKGKFMAYSILKYEYIGLGKWAITRNLRLFRNRPEIRYNKGKIHSSISYSLRDNNLISNDSKIMTPIRHWDILCGKKASRKREKYIHMMQESINDTRNVLYKASLYNYLSQEYFAVGDLYHAKLCIDTAQDTHDIAYNLSQVYLIIYHLKREEFRDALNVCCKLLKNCENKANYKRTLILMAETYLKMDEWDKATETYMKIFEEVPIESYDYMNMGALLMKVDLQQSYKMFLKALSVDNYLYNPIIYKQGDKPNTFEHQSVFLSCTDNIFVCLIRCCDLLGKTQEKEKYVHIYNNILEKASQF